MSSISTEQVPQRSAGIPDSDVNLTTATIRLAPKRRLQGLTGLRGAAALWVVIVHLFKGYPNAVIESGWLGVDFFFILSGFVLSYVYADTVRNWGWQSYFRFLRLRLARIYPLHFVMLCVVGVIVLTLPNFAERYPTADLRWGWQSFVASLLLIQNWGHFMATAWNTPAWSLSAEWFAYLAFPLFMIATQWPRSVWLPLALACAALACQLGMLTLLGALATNVTGVPGMMRMACEFAIGCLIFRATVNGLPPLRAWADILAAALLAVALAIGPTNLLALPACALLVMLAVNEQSMTARMLALAPLVWLGEISYSLYLVHWPIVQILNWAVDGHSAMTPVAMVIAKLLILVFSILISVGTYYAIERPARRFGRRLAA